MLPFASALIIMLASLGGMVFASRGIGSWMERHLPYLATFSIGIFAVVTWGLFDESLSAGNWIAVAISALAGMLAVKIFSNLIPDAHHHHDPHPSHGHSMLDGRRIVLGDAVHNIADGLLLVPAFIADIRLGIAVSAGIFIHELVQGVSEFFILKESGYPARKALFMIFAASSTILIGVASAVFLSSIESLESLLIAIAAGGFLYTILFDLVPHAFSNIREKGHGNRHAKAILAGIILMLAIGILLPEQADAKILDIDGILCFYSYTN